MSRVVVSGAFDDLRSPQVRFLQEASRLGELHVLLWPDAMFRAVTGRAPRFSLEEREYLIRAIRYVNSVHVLRQGFPPDTLPLLEEMRPALWAVSEAADYEARRTYCIDHGLSCRLIGPEQLQGFPEEKAAASGLPGPAAAKKVLVTGCFDWFHSGHVRFFEEVSALGALYVVVGHDSNIRLLKGEGHPLFPEQERRYMVQAVRYVTQALISTGDGWLDAEPEILRLQPDIYAVNEDGDKPEKRAFCEKHGIEYRVMKRRPREGLPARQSTDLRGF